MLSRQFHPLQVNSQTGEPFLRLPEPFETIIITPPRPSDVSKFADTLKDVDISKWLFTAAHPYTEKDAALKLARAVAGYEKVLKELKNAETAFPDGPLQFVDGCPVSCIRKIQEDGSQVYLGGVEVARDRFVHLGNEELRRKTVAANDTLPVGDENVVWSMGDFLTKSHHGRGIMTAAVGAIIREWMVPRMNARSIQVGAFAGNAGSVRVFEKNGFVVDKTLDVDIVNAAGIRHRSLICLSWNRHGQSA